MKRLLSRTLIALSLAICLVSLILWPISFFRVLVVQRMGERRNDFLTLVGGGITYQSQDGSAVENNIRRATTQYAELRTIRWFFRTGRNREHYFDYRQSWRETVRFSADRRTTTFARTGETMNQRWLTIPLWASAWVGAIAPALALKRRLLRRGRRRRGECMECGYDVRASSERCPECGTAITSACAAR